MPHKQVLVVRRDLDLSPGKLAVQCSHGAVDAALSAQSDHRGWFDAWKRQAQKKVCLGVDDEDALQDLLRRVEDRGLPHKLVRDAGRTEIPEGTVTVLAIGPAPEDKLDPLTGSLKLL